MWIYSNPFGKSLLKPPPAYELGIIISNVTPDGEVGDTKFRRPNVLDFNIISTMKNKNNSNLAVRRGKVNISILC